jgi:uncharacterized protein YlxP (DUF503 family)
MKVGIVTLVIEIPSSFSLKDKRRVLNSIKSKLKNRFNISISEIGEKDLWNRAELGIAIISDNTSFCNEQLGKVMEFIEKFPDIVVLSVNQEMI